MACFAIVGGVMLLAGIVFIAIANGTEEFVFSSTDRQCSEGGY
jgi:hypothetical protein